MIVLSLHDNPSDHPIATSSYRCIDDDDNIRNRLLAVETSLVKVQTSLKLKIVLQMQLKIIRRLLVMVMRLILMRWLIKVNRHRSGRG